MARIIPLALLCGAASALPRLQQVPSYSRNGINPMATHPCVKENDYPGLCPLANGTIYTTPNGDQWQIDCYADYCGRDMPMSPVWVNSLEACITVCSARDGCLDVKWEPGNPGPCYLRESMYRSHRHENCSMWSASRYCCKGNVGSCGLSCPPCTPNPIPPTDNPYWPNCTSCTPSSTYHPGTAVSTRSFNPSNFSSSSSYLYPESYTSYTYSSSSFATTSRTPTLVKYLVAPTTSGRPTRSSTSTSTSTVASSVTSATAIVPGPVNNHPPQGGTVRQPETEASHSGTYVLRRWAKGPPIKPRADTGPEYAPQCPPGQSSCPSTQPDPSPEPQEQYGYPQPQEPDGQPQPYPQPEPDGSYGQPQPYPDESYGQPQPYPLPEPDEPYGQPPQYPYPKPDQPCGHSKPHPCPKPCPNKPHPCIPPRPPPGHHTHPSGPPTHWLWKQFTARFARLIQAAWRLRHDQDSINQRKQQLRCDLEELLKWIRDQLCGVPPQVALQINDRMQSMIADFERILYDESAVPETMDNIQYTDGGYQVKTDTPAGSLRERGDENEVNGDPDVDVYAMAEEYRHMRSIDTIVSEYVRGMFSNNTINYYNDDSETTCYFAKFCNACPITPILRDSHTFLVPGDCDGCPPRVMQIPSESIQLGPTYPVPGGGQAGHIECGAPVCVSCAEPIEHVPESSAGPITQIGDGQVQVPHHETHAPKPAPYHPHQPENCTVHTSEGTSITICPTSRHTYPYTEVKTTAKPVTQIGDGQIQVPHHPHPLENCTLHISDGTSTTICPTSSHTYPHTEVRTTAKPITQINDGQIQVPHHVYQPENCTVHTSEGSSTTVCPTSRSTPKPITQISDGQIQAPHHAITSVRPLPYPPHQPHQPENCTVHVTEGTSTTVCPTSRGTPNPITQISDGQIQVPHYETHVPKPLPHHPQPENCTVQVTEGTSTTVCPTSRSTPKPITQISDGQIQVPHYETYAPKPLPYHPQPENCTVEISEGTSTTVCPTSRSTPKPITQISDGQIQVPHYQTYVPRPLPYHPQLENCTVHISEGTPTTVCPTSQHTYPYTEVESTSHPAHNATIVPTPKPSPCMHGKCSETTSFDHPDNSVYVGRPISQICDGQVQVPGVTVCHDVTTPQPHTTYEESTCLPPTCNSTVVYTKTLVTHYPVVTHPRPITHPMPTTHVVPVSQICDGQVQGPMCNTTYAHPPPVLTDFPIPQTHITYEVSTCLPPTCKDTVVYTKVPATHYPVITHPRPITHPQPTTHVVPISQICDGQIQGPICNSSYAHPPPVVTHYPATTVETTTCLPPVCNSSTVLTTTYTRPTTSIHHTTVYTTASTKVVPCHICPGGSFTQTAVVTVTTPVPNVPQTHFVPVTTTAPGSTYTETSVETSYSTRHETKTVVCPYCPHGHATFVETTIIPTPVTTHTFTLPTQVIPPQTHGPVAHVTFVPLPSPTTETETETTVASYTCSTCTEATSETLTTFTVAHGIPETYTTVTQGTPTTYTITRETPATYTVTHGTQEIFTNVVQETPMTYTVTRGTPETYTTVTHGTPTTYTLTHETPATYTVAHEIPETYMTITQGTPTTYTVTHGTPATYTVMHGTPTTCTVTHGIPGTYTTVAHETPATYTVTYETPGTYTTVAHGSPTTYTVTHGTPATHIVTHGTPETYTVTHETPATVTTITHSTPTTYTTITHGTPATYTVTHGTPATYTVTHGTPTTYTVAHGTPATYTSVTHGPPIFFTRPCYTCNATTVPIQTASTRYDTQVVTRPVPVHPTVVPGVPSSATTEVPVLPLIVPCTTCSGGFTVPSSVTAPSGTPTTPVTTPNTPVTFPSVTHGTPEVFTSPTTVETGTCSTCQPETTTAATTPGTVPGVVPEVTHGTPEVVTSPTTPAAGTCSTCTPETATAPMIPGTVPSVTHGTAEIPSGPLSEITLAPQVPHGTTGFHGAVTYPSLPAGTTEVPETPVVHHSTPCPTCPVPSGPTEIPKGNTVYPPPGTTHIPGVQTVHPPVGTTIIPENNTVFPPAGTTHVPQGNTVYSPAGTTRIPGGNTVIPPAGTPQVFPHGNTVYPPAETTRIPEDNTIYPPAGAIHFPHGDTVYAPAGTAEICEGSTVCPPAGTTQIPEGSTVLPPAGTTGVPVFNPVHSAAGTVHVSGTNIVYPPAGFTEVPEGNTVHPPAGTSQGIGGNTVYLPAGPTEIPEGNTVHPLPGTTHVPGVHTVHAPAGTMHVPEGNTVYPPAGTTGIPKGNTVHLPAGTTYTQGGQTVSLPTGTTEIPEGNTVHLPAGSTEIPESHTVSGTQATTPRTHAPPSGTVKPLPSQPAESSGPSAVFHGTPVTAEAHTYSIVNISPPAPTRGGTKSGTPGTAATSYFLTKPAPGTTHGIPGGVEAPSGTPAENSALPTGAASTVSAPLSGVSALAFILAALAWFM